MVQLAADPRCKITADPWLSGVLGRKAVRLDLPTPASRAGDELRAMDEPLFAYAKAPTDWGAALGGLQDDGFRLVDTNIQLRKPVEPRSAGASAVAIGFAAAADQDAVVALARTGFHCSRFHLDPRMPKRLADRVKAEWVRNYFRGQRGDAMIVAHAGGAPVGFCMLLRPEPHRWIIDLIAVAEQCRGQGVARGMIGFLESQADGARELIVGTQAANLGSLRLYEGLGFRICQTQYVFHYHSDSWEIS